MKLQQVDGITYVNGIRLETETIPVADIDEALLIMQEDIAHHKEQIEKLLIRRDEIILHAIKHGFSVIKIAKLLKLTRQGVYERLKQYKNEEE
jgi:DNA-binding NarL/FixJ family response regulator